MTSTAAENARLEAEAPVDEVDVVVDRLGDPDDADGELAPRDLLRRASWRRAASRRRPRRRGCRSPGGRGGRPSRAGLARRASVPSAVPPSWWMSATVAGVELDGLVPCSPTRPCVAVAEAEDLADAVALRQLEDEPADHVVDPRAQAAAGDDPAAEARGLEEDAVARPRELEGRRARGSARCSSVRQAVVEEDPVGLADVVDRASARAGRRAATGSGRRRAP